MTFAFRDFFGISHSILDSLPVVLVCMKRTLFCMKRDVTYVCVYVHHVKQSGKGSKCQISDDEVLFVIRDAFSDGHVSQ